MFKADSVQPEVTIYGRTLISKNFAKRRFSPMI